MYSIVSVCTRFGVHDTGYSLSPPLFSHSCLAKARARWNESERKPLVSLRLSDAVSLRRTQSVPSRSHLRPERSEKRALGIRVAVHYTGYSPVPTSEYIRRQYCTRFGVHDTGYSLSPPLFSHSCLAKARARWNESERKPLVSLRLSDAVSLRRTQSVPSRSPLRPERSEKRTLGIRVAVHYTGYSPVSTSEYIRRQYCISKICKMYKIESIFLTSS